MIKEFIDFMADHGVQPANPSEITETFEKKPKRYLTVNDKPKDPTGYYKFNIDGDFAYGFCGSYRFGDTHTFSSKSKKSFSEAEKKAWREKYEAKKAEEERIQQELWDTTAKRAQNIIKSADELTTHPYLERKGVCSFTGMKNVAGKIMIPVYRNKAITSIQYIEADGSKKFLPNGQIDGGYFPIVDRRDSKHKFLICEGVATGLTLREASSLPVICAFNANNLKPVSEYIRGQYPDAEIIICADNDQWTPDYKKVSPENVDRSLPGDHEQWQQLAEDYALINVGLEKAKAAAYAVSGYVCVPEVPANDADKRTDFNDVHLTDGLDAVSTVIDRVGDAVVAEHLGLKEQQSVTAPQQEAAVPTKLNWLDQIVWKNRDNGKLDKEKSLHNAIIWLGNHDTWKGKFCYDEFAHKTVIISPLRWDKQDPWHPRDVENMDLTRIKAHLEMHDMSLPQSTIKDAIEVAAHEYNRFNPVREYFERLEWDKIPRLDTWLRDYAIAKDQPQEYLRVVGSKWMIGAAERVYNPGAKFETMLVLEGDQAAGKSTLLRELATFGKSRAETYFTDRFSFSQIEDKYAALHLLGNLIVEFQELNGLSAKDRNKVKDWISQDTDEIRKPFASQTDKYPRQYVLAGTTNETNWMTDPTGGRRFWPVSVCGLVDIQGLREVKEQLWAEAVYRHKQGEPSYIRPDDKVYDLFLKEQSDRFVGDAWDQIVAEGVHTMIGTVTTDRIMSEVLGIPKDRWNNREKGRINGIMRHLGYKNQTVRINGKVTRGWVRKDD